MMAQFEILISYENIFFRLSIKLRLSSTWIYTAEFINGIDVYIFALNDLWEVHPLLKQVHLDFVCSLNTANVFKS